MKRTLNTPRTDRWPVNWFLPLTCSLLLLAAAVGCQPKVEVATDVDPSGTYALASIDGKQVPCTLNHEGATLTVKSGSFIINSNGTCSSKMDFTVQNGGGGSREVKATYARQGSVLTMKWEGAGMTLGSVQGNTFTMTNEGMVLAYKK